MNRNQIRTLFDQINVWKRGDQRAPHKPLLILYALGKCLRKEEHYIPYSEIDEKLRKLLVEFGPSRKSHHPEYPFWRLQNDGIWKLSCASNIGIRKGNTDAKRTDLLKMDVRGGFTDDVYRMLSEDRKLLIDILNQILNENFPASIHEDILQAVGIDLKDSAAKAKARDPYFRDRVLKAYEYRCAVCGFNVRIGDSLVALEAAHIKWHQAGGPDQENNGIALCTMHHKLFDRGAFTIADDMKMKVSEIVHGTNGFNEWLMAYHGKEIRSPQRSSYYPAPKFALWHLNEVFKGYARQDVRRM